MSETDDLIEKYSKILVDIYERQTAGDYTFTGVLAAYTREFRDIQMGRRPVVLPAGMKITCIRCGHEDVDHGSDGCTLRTGSRDCPCSVPRSVLGSINTITQKENQ